MPHPPKSHSANCGMLKKSIDVDGGTTTTAPVHATPAYIASEDPEFLDADGVKARFSIRRSLLYELHYGGHIKSVSLRRRGQSRGKRLFSVDSISRISSQADGGRRMKAKNLIRREVLIGSGWLLLILSFVSLAVRLVVSVSQRAVLGCS